MAGEGLRSDLKIGGIAFDVPMKRVLLGAPRRFYEMPFGERYIWGITAGIIRALYERLYA